MILQIFVKKREKREKITIKNGKIPIVKEENIMDDKELKLRILEVISKLTCWEDEKELLDTCKLLYGWIVEVDGEDLR